MRLFFCGSSGFWVDFWASTQPLHTLAHCARRSRLIIVDLDDNKEAGCIHSETWDVMMKKRVAKESFSAIRVPQRGVYHWGQKDYLSNLYSRRIIIGNSMCFGMQREKYVLRTFSFLMEIKGERVQMQANANFRLSETPKTQRKVHKREQTQTNASKRKF